MKTSTVVFVCLVCLCVISNQIYGYSIANEDTDQLTLSTSRDLHSNQAPHFLLHRQKRGFRAGVADRIAHGFGKRKTPVYNSVDRNRVNRLADLFNTGYRDDDIPLAKIGIPVIQLGKQFHDDQNAPLDYLGSFLDRNGDGYLESNELYGDQYVPDI